MKAKRSPKKMTTAEKVKLKPVRVDLDPAVHHALRRAAADENVSMAALARKLITDAMASRRSK